eukprot:m.1545233 g.1545233  ORF g.1545233 m.1545233 type:complete len:1906 (+) comp25259_c0_seq6:407-6124(+)
MGRRVSRSSKSRTSTQITRLGSVFSSKKSNSSTDTSDTLEGGGTRDIYIERRAGTVFDFAIGYTEDRRHVICSSQSNLLACGDEIRKLDGLDVRHLTHLKLVNLFSGIYHATLTIYRHPRTHFRPTPTYISQTANLGHRTPTGASNAPKTKPGNSIRRESTEKAHAPPFGAIANAEGVRRNSERQPAEDDDVIRPPVGDGQSRRSGVGGPRRPSRKLPVASATHHTGKLRAQPEFPRSLSEFPRSHMHPNLTTTPPPRHTASPPPRTLAEHMQQARLQQASGQPIHQTWATVPHGRAPVGSSPHTVQSIPTHHHAPSPAVVTGPRVGFGSEDDDVPLFGTPSKEATLTSDARDTPTKEARNIPTQGHRQVPGTIGQQVKGPAAPMHTARAPPARTGSLAPDTAGDAAACARDLAADEVPRIMQEAVAAVALVLPAVNAAVARLVGDGGVTMRGCMASERWQAGLRALGRRRDATFFADAEQRNERTPKAASEEAEDDLGQSDDVAAATTTVVFAVPAIGTGARRCAVLGFRLKGTRILARTAAAGHFVAHVSAGSLAAAAGLRAGQRVLSVDGARVNHCSHDAVVSMCAAGAPKNLTLEVTEDPAGFQKLLTMVSLVEATNTAASVCRTVSLFGCHPDATMDDLGIGLVLISEYNSLYVQCVVKTSPAWQAGLRTGDLLLSVNGVTVHDKAIDEVVALLCAAGRAGGAVDLRVESDMVGYLQTTHKLDDLDDEDVPSTSGDALPIRDVVISRADNGSLGFSVVGPQVLSHDNVQDAIHVRQAIGHAHTAGLRQGDRILVVNGVACAGRSVDAVMQQLARAPPSAPVSLRVRRDASGYRAQQAALDVEGTVDDGMRRVTLTRSATRGWALGVSLVGPTKLFGNPQHDAHFISAVSPEAFAAGVRVADKVVAIDGVACSGSTLGEIVALLRNVRERVVFTVIHDPSGLAAQLAQYDLDETAAPGQPHDLAKACPDTDHANARAGTAQPTAAAADASHAPDERTVVLTRNADGRLGVSLVGSDRVDPADAASAHYVSAVGPAAAAAGLCRGDRVVAIDGVPCPGRALAFVVAQLEQAGARVVLTVVPVTDSAGTLPASTAAPQSRTSITPPDGAHPRSVAPTPPPLEAPGLSVTATPGSEAVPRTVTIQRTGSGSFGLSIVGPNQILGSPAHDAHYVASVTEYAAAAGLRVGDKVLRIDGATCAGLLRPDIIAKVAGCGPQAVLEVVHDPTGMHAQREEFVEDPVASPRAAPPLLAPPPAATPRNVVLSRDTGGTLGLSVSPTPDGAAAGAHVVTDVSPSAALSGLTEGDRLVSVDGVPCQGRALATVEAQLRAVKEHTVLGVASDDAGAASTTEPPPSYADVCVDTPLRTDVGVATAAGKVGRGTAVTAAVTGGATPSDDEASIGRMSPTRRGYVRRVLLVRDATSGSFGITLVGPNTLVGDPSHDAHFVSSVAGPAATAGLRVGDKVLSINGKPCDGHVLRETVATLQTCHSLVTVEVVHDPAGMVSQAAQRRDSAPGPIANPGCVPAAATEAKSAVTSQDNESDYLMVAAPSETASTPSATSSDPNTPPPLQAGDAHRVGRTVTVPRVDGILGFSMTGPDKLTGERKHDAFFVSKVSDAAARTGLKSRDRILEINGVSTKGKVHAQVTAEMKRSGTQVVLRVLSDADEAYSFDAGRVLPDTDCIDDGDSMMQSLMEANQRTVTVARNASGSLGFGLSGPDVLTSEAVHDAVFVTHVQASAKKSGLQIGDRIVSIDGASTQHKVLAEVTRQLKAVHDSVDLTVVADVAGMEAQAAQLEAELAGLDQSDLGNTTGPISRSTPLVPVRRIVLDKSHGGKFGFNLQKSTDGGLRVKRILKASLAQSNGLRVNDHVVTLNGHDVSAFTIAQALNIIRAAGNVLHIEVKRS